jgi:Carbohydrate-selective porin, OprB family/S-layer homology domain
MNALSQSPQLVITASLGCLMIGALPAIAQPSLTRTEQIIAETSLEPDQPDESFPLVSQLSDVRPTDWAYQALKSLVEKRGVIVGYPDDTFRGDRAISRYEFAAGMNAALDRVNADMQEEFAKYATKEELEAVKRMQEEFAQELAAVKSGQLGSNDRLVQTLGRSFSLASKLNGEAIFQTSFIGGAERAEDRSRGLDRQLTLSQRSKIEITTSFTGKDLLTTSLKASNLPNLARASGTDMLRLGVQGDSNNQLDIDEISYRFRIGKPMTARLIAAGGSLTDFAKPLNPFLDDSGDGAISRFAQRNPIFRQGSGAGAGLSYKFNDQIRLGIGYVGDDLNDPIVGFNNAGYGAIAQLTISPSDNFDLGLTYVRSYNTVRTGTGSRRANDPFAGSSNAIVSHSFGLQTSLAMSPAVHLSGWLGWTQAYASDLNNDPKADIFNWAITLAFPDVGGTGNLLGFAIGQPPKVTSNEFTRRGQANTDRDTALHLEGFYRWRVNDNVAFTAGVLIVTNPEHDRNNSALYSGVLRSTFSF